MQVHQLLRNKLNRIHAGIRKKKALSVQEVFENNTQQKQQPQNISAPLPGGPTFYVPSPYYSYDFDHDCDHSSITTDSGPSSLPYIQEISTSSSPIMQTKTTLFLHNDSLINDGLKDENRNWYSSTDKVNNNGNRYDNNLLHHHPHHHHHALNNINNNNFTTTNGSNSIIINTSTNNNNNTSKTFITNNNNNKPTENGNKVAASSPANSRKNSLTETPAKKLSAFGKFKQKSPVRALAERVTNRSELPVKKGDSNNKNRPRPRSHSPMRNLCVKNTKIPAPSAQKEKSIGLLERFNRIIHSSNNSNSQNENPVKSTPPIPPTRSVSRNVSVKRDSTSPSSEKPASTTTTATNISQPNYRAMKVQSRTRTPSPALNGHNNSSPKAEIAAHERDRKPKQVSV